MTELEFIHLLGSLVPRVISKISADCRTTISEISLRYPRSRDWVDVGSSINVLSPQCGQVVLIISGKYTLKM